MMVNEALNNYITLMNFAYVLSRETDQSNRMNHTTVTDKHLGGLHLRKKSTFENQRPTRMCRMFLNISFINFSSLSLKNRCGSNFCQKRETATRHDVIFISTSSTRCCMVKTTKFSLTLSWYTSHWLGNCFSSEFTEEGCNTTLPSDLQRSKKIPQKLPPNLGFTLLMVRGNHTNAVWGYQAHSTSQINLKTLTTVLAYSRRSVREKKLRNSKRRNFVAIERKGERLGSHHYAPRPSLTRFFRSSATIALLFIN